MAGHDLDILHPLVEHEWKCVRTIHSRQKRTGYQSVLVHRGRIYLGGKTDKLMVIDFKDDFSWYWSHMKTPASAYALTNHGSRMVLVGGVCTVTKEYTDKLWVSDDGVKWEELLPPMPSKRASPSVLSPPGSPQRLVVAGGVVEMSPLTRVDVLTQGEWSTLEPLPFPCHEMSSAFHNGNWYLSTQFFTCCCKLESLLKSTPANSDSNHREQSWFHLQGNMTQPDQPYTTELPVCCSITSFGQRLVAFSYSNMYAYSHTTQLWVKLGRGLPLSAHCNNKSSVVLPTGELVLLSDELDGNRVTKLSLSAPSFDANALFSMSGLYGLESAGILVVAELAKILSRLEAASGHFLNDYEKKDFSTYSPERCLEVFIDNWVFFKRGNLPTWKSLLDILKKLDLEELSEMTEVYLTDFKSLKERCVSVIMSALLPQWCLTPEQLQVRLPAYVPTVTRRHLLHCFRELTSLQEPSGQVEKPFTKRPKLLELLS